MAFSSSLQAWAVEPRTIQCTWGALDPGRIKFRTGPSQWIVEHPGGPGSIELDGLEPDTHYEISIKSERADGSELTDSIQAKTLKAPGGAELARVATISDLHVGTDHFGFFKTMKESPTPKELHSVRCARSAISAAQAWGADLLVIKGDAAHHRQQSDYDALGSLVDEFPDLEMILIPGNHDVDSRSEIELPESVGERKLRFETEAQAYDLPGLRVVTTDTSRPGRGSGTILPTQDGILELSAERSTGSGLLLATHHQFQALPVPTYWPAGISGTEARPFLARLREIAPRAFVTSGHTHRCRAYKRGSIQLTEVSSTSDYPGSWAGYIVYEGGITQSVRRITTRSEMEWLEYSKMALFGLWGEWSPGTIKQRCLTHWWED